MGITTKKSRNHHYQTKITKINSKNRQKLPMGINSKNRRKLPTEITNKE